MQIRCTCGAYPPDDARFCHKCGRPLTAEVAAEEASEQIAPVVVALPPPLPPSVPASISFSNGRAVSISMVVAGCALFGIFVFGSIATFFVPVVLCAAGFSAVTLYNRRLAKPPTTADGARLGWMTGLWLFLIFAVIAALISVMVANPTFREQLRAGWSKVPELANKLDDPHEFLMSLLMTLVSVFFVLTLLPGLGGILGALLLMRRRQSS